MAPDRGGTAREMALRALERIDGHEGKCDDRWTELRAAREAEAEERQRWQLEQRATKSEIFRKFDDISEQVGQAEQAASKLGNRFLWAALAGMGALLMTALGAAAFLADKLYSKGPLP